MGIQQQFRNSQRATSNNPNNTNKNLCALAVCNALGVGGATRYLHVRKDTKYAVRTKYSCRSVWSALGAKNNKTTVAAARKAMAQHDAQGLLAYLVFVDGHVMLMDRQGGVEVDTDPRKADRRKVREVYGVYAK